jgi:hypothetical protein
VTLRTLYEALCDRCGVTEGLSELKAPSGWGQVTSPRSQRSVGLCPRCCREVSDFVEHRDSDMPKAAVR